MRFPSENYMMNDNGEGPPVVTDMQFILSEGIRFYKLALYLSGQVKDSWSCQSSQSKARKYSVITFSSVISETSKPNLPDRDGTNQGLSVRVVSRKSVAEQTRKALRKRRLGN